MFKSPPPHPPIVSDSLLNAVRPRNPIFFLPKHNFSLLLSFPLFYLATVEFRSSVDGGVCAQEHAVKSSLVLATKKSVTYPGDHQETSAKPPLYHKQPPALPPKPFPRIPNHSTGPWFLTRSDLVSLHPAASHYLRLMSSTRKMMREQVLEMDKE